MKTIKLLAFGVLAILLSCCDESRIYMKYHFFTKSELENLYINVDSVVEFQKNLFFSRSIETDDSDKYQT